VLEPRLRAFLLSLGIHAAGVVMLLQASQRGWLEVRPATPNRDRIAAERRRLIWYVQKAELPPVAPLDASPPDKAKGPSERAAQKIQANSPQPESRRQLILQSPPEIRLAADLPLPNLLAWNPTPPPEPRRRFQIQAPPVQRPAPKPLETPAPEVAANPSAAPKLPVELPARPRFQVPERTPPIQRPAPKPLETLAPEVAANPSAAPKLPVELPARPRFQVPERSPRAPAAPVPVVAPEAPQLAMAPVPDPSAGRLQPVPEIERPRFVVPSRAPRGPVGPKPVTGEAPQVAVAPGAVGTVIVGLDPVAAPLPPPPGNRSAEFSAGPDATGNGGNGGSQPAQTAELRIPHLSIAPAPAAALTRPRQTGEDRAAFRRQLLSTLAVTRTALDASPHSASPDPVLRGSTVYTMAVDMPNITSFDGSWTVRFTELGGSSPNDLLTAPVALRKVDPKYIAAAAAEGVEGKVLLYAVIRRDGRVDQVRLVQGIDERLDTSALAAFAKWEFQPATKNGVPVDLEAVVQIPFRLRKASARP
jgi:TonB family protein